jgi:hypothetical protein
VSTLCLPVFLAERHGEAPGVGAPQVVERSFWVSR